MRFNKKTPTPLKHLALVATLLLSPFAAQAEPISEAQTLMYYAEEHMGRDLDSQTTSVVDCKILLAIQVLNEHDRLCFQSGGNCKPIDISVLGELLQVCEETATPPATTGGRNV